MKQTGITSTISNQHVLQSDISNSCRLPIQDRKLQCTSPISVEHMLRDILINPQAFSNANCNATWVDFIVVMLTAVVESQGSQAWVLLAVEEACLVSTLEGGRQGILGEACLGASAQQPHSC